MSRSEEHTSELQSPCNLVCRLLLEKKKQATTRHSAAPQRLTPSTCYPPARPTLVVVGSSWHPFSPAVRPLLLFVFFFFFFGRRPPPYPPPSPPRPSPPS